MIYFGLLFSETIILFLLSRLMSKTLSGFMSINFLSFIFLPGIIVHELAHLLMAVILFVPVGQMEFMPKKSGNTVKLGSVEIGRTDPIRRSLIGFAPIFAGFSIIVTLVYFFSSNFSLFQDKGFYLFVALILLLIYLLFAVSNTMFSSSKDLEGTVEILIILLIIFIAAYVLGLRPQFSILDKIFTKEFIALIQKSILFLLAPMTIDLVILGIVKLVINNRNRSVHR